MMALGIALSWRILLLSRRDKARYYMNVVNHVEDIR